MELNKRKRRTKRVLFVSALFVAFCSDYCGVVSSPAAEKEWDWGGDFSIAGAVNYDFLIRGWHTMGITTSVDCNTKEDEFALSFDRGYGLDF